jgi:hypothetical protein
MRTLELVNRNVVRVAGFAAVVLLPGCVTVSHKPMTKESSAQLQMKKVAASSYATPDFAAMTPTKAAFGLIGAAAMISEGNSIVKANGVEDPYQSPNANCAAAFPPAARFTSAAISGGKPAASAGDLVFPQPNVATASKTKTSHV